MTDGKTMRIAIATLLLLASAAVAQVPIVGGGVTAFDPEISVVNSGAVLDAQAVVSHDRRYVNINMRPSNSNVIAVRDFPVQGVAAATGFGGFAGGAEAGSAEGQAQRAEGGPRRSARAGRGSASAAARRHGRRRCSSGHVGRG